MAALRGGAERTLSRAVHAFSRRARYRGPAETGLRDTAATAAIDPDRLAARAGRPRPRCRWCRRR